MIALSQQCSEKFTFLAIKKSSRMQLIEVNCETGIDTRSTRPSYANTKQHRPKLVICCHCYVAVRNDNVLFWITIQADRRSTNIIICFIVMIAQKTIKCTCTSVTNINLHLTTSKVMVIVWRLRGNTLRTVVIFCKACSGRLCRKLQHASPEMPG